MGLIAFHFACFGAGTPQFDEFAHRKNAAQPAQIAPHAFLSRLPQRLLGHPRGGALAVISHVDRAWGYSFYSGEAGAQLQAFSSALTYLMEGHPAGSAMEFFNQRYASLTAELDPLRTDIARGLVQYDRKEFAALWTASIDARNYAVLGDPTVRLPVQDGDPLV